MMQISREELNELRALIERRALPAPEEDAPAPRPLITQNEFLAACVIASLILLILVK